MLAPPVPLQERGEPLAIGTALLGSSLLPEEVISGLSNTDMDLKAALPGVQEAGSWASVCVTALRLSSTAYLPNCFWLRKQEKRENK